MIRRAFLLALAVAALFASSLAVEAQPSVTIGILAPEGEGVAADWERVADHLGQALSGPEVRLRYFDLEQLRAAVAGGKIDFFVTNSGHYVELEAAYGAHRIATLEDKSALSPTEAIASAVVVRADRRDLRSFDDLRGKRVQAVAHSAFGGFRVAWGEMREAGIEPARHFASLDFVGFPLQKIVRAVERGETDAGIVRACLLESMAQRGEIRLEVFRVLNTPAADQSPCLRSTRFYPDWPMAALKHTPHELSKRVATALLAMPATPGGISWTVPTDYQSVHELFRNLEVGPYAHLSRHGLRALFYEYRWWLLAAGLLIVAWVIHTVRVEYLVHTRTSALRDALAARELAEREARAQQVKLDHLARLGILGELSSMLAHELNQPLSAIGNFARGMERRIEAGRLEPDPLLAASQEIAEQAERARAIMQRIRAFSKKREGPRENFRLRDAVDSALRLFEGIGMRAPRVAVDVDGAAITSGDQLQIEQVLLNLLKNALDAMGGVPAGERRIEIACTREGDMHRVCVSDNGSGLDEAQRARLFEPFFTTKPDGMGLGLTICKRIIEAHGGRLWTPAPPDGGGFTICFTLPAPEPDEPSLTGAADAIADEARGAQAMHEAK